MRAFCVQPFFQKAGKGQWSPKLPLRIWPLRSLNYEAAIFCVSLMQHLLLMTGNYKQCTCVCLYICITVDVAY